MKYKPGLKSFQSNNDRLLSAFGSWRPPHWPYAIFNFWWRTCHEIAKSICTQLSWRFHIDKAKLHVSVFQTFVFSQYFQTETDLHCLNKSDISLFGLACSSWLPYRICLTRFEISLGSSFLPPLVSSSTDLEWPANTRSFDQTPKSLSFLTNTNAVFLKISEQIRSLRPRKRHSVIRNASSLSRSNAHSKKL